MIQIAKILFDIVYSILEAVLNILSDIMVSAVPSRRKVQYDADFISPGKIFQKNGNGFTISTWSTSTKQSHEHMLVAGGSGSFKSSSVVFNTCLSLDNVSLVIHDPAREIIKTASALKQLGYTIKVLDYDNPQKSEGMNVLAQCTIEDVYKIANVIVSNSLEQSKNDFWAKSAENLIALFGKYLVLYAEPEYKSLPSLLEMVNIFSYEPKKLDKAFVATKDQQLINEYKATIAIPDKTLLSIVATAKSALACFSSPNLQKITSMQTFSFKDLRNKKTALFLCHSPAHADIYKTVSATFFEMLWSHILSSPIDKTEYPLYFIVDEAASMYLTSLSSAVSLLRKHYCSIALFIQDYSQLHHLYGKHQAENIISNCALKVFMPCAKPIETCLMLEKMLGKFQFEEDGTVRSRELLTAQEIRQLTKILVLYSNYSATLLDVVPYFEIKKFQSLMDLPPYIVPNVLPSGRAPLIHFDT